MFVDSKEASLLFAWQTSIESELRARERRGGYEPFVWPVRIEPFVQYARSYRRIDEAILELIRPLVREVQASDVQHQVSNADPQALCIFPSGYPLFPEEKSVAIDRAGGSNFLRNKRD